MKVLVVAVHPDDETLGCGGTLLRHKASGDELHWLIVTEAGTDHPAHAKRSSQIPAVGRSYGFAGTHQLRLPTTRLDTLPVSDLIENIAGVFKAVRPDIVYLPFCNDVHSDHRVVFNATFSCSKTFRAPYLKRILMMETVSETEFAPVQAGSAYAPNVFVDISVHLDEKLRIAQLYDDELGEHPFPRSLENLRALATMRGATAGCRYAESFVLLKEII
jgi:LmbE family N-acetylglucosaminyl deacetylase